jgi:Rieske Fe-S protein
MVIGAAAAIGPACAGREARLGGTDGGGEANPPPAAPATDAEASGEDASGSSSNGGSSGGPSGSSGNGGTSSSSGTNSGTGDGGSSGSTGGAGRDGSAGCTTGGKVVTLAFSQYPALMTVGNAVRITAPGYSDPSCNLGDINVVQAAPGSYVAISASCTHQCCDLKYVPGSPWAFQCPCDGAEFDITGKSSGLRTTAPLQTLAVCVDSYGVYITIP